MLKGCVGEVGVLCLTMSSIYQLNSPFEKSKTCLLKIGRTLQLFY